MEVQLKVHNAQVEAVTRKLLRIKGTKKALKNAQVKVIAENGTGFTLFRYTLV